MSGETKYKPVKRYLLPVSEVDVAGDVQFYRYTKPFTRPPTGFGYMGTLSYDPSTDKIMCHLCGGWFNHLPTHLQHKHDKISAAQYREKFGLLKTTALINEGCRNKMVEKAIERCKNNNNWVKTMRKVRASRKTAKAAKRETAEVQNRYGSCPLQLLQKVKDLSVKLGRTPSANDFKANGVDIVTSLRVTFGSLTEAMRQAGLSPNPKHGCGKERHHNWVPTETLTMLLKRFWKENGRPPSGSDYRRGVLPSRQLYIRRFGGMLNAAEASGIDPARWFNLSRKAKGWRKGPTHKAVSP